jgi:hypothetical protein
MINPGFPLFLNEGTYIYLYHDGFTLLMDSFAARKGKQAFNVTDGMIFNLENKREGDETVLSSGCPADFI